jgi:hypothetical protein
MAPARCRRLPPYASFEDMLPRNHPHWAADVEVAKQLYGSPDNVELLVGINIEKVR